MFNSVNNPFGQRIESAKSTGQDKQQKGQEQQKDEEKRYLENDEKDEVKLGGLPILTEDGNLNENDIDKTFLVVVTTYPAIIQHR